jgi:hypothetical protein
LFLILSPEFLRKACAPQPGYRRGVIQVQISSKERRQAPRENLSLAVRIRPCDPRYSGEVCTALNVSRTGVYFATSTDHYFPGMNVLVVLNYRAGDPLHRELMGDVVRLEKLDNDKWGVAIRILMHGNPGVYSGT